MLEKKIARCNFSWNGPSPLIYPFLALYIGEKVTVSCSCDDWSYGSSLDNGDRFGIFPNNAVISFNESIPPISNEAIEIIEELTDILKEWWHTVKNTYYHQARMECQDEVLVYMEDLMVMRKKILSGNVPIEELREMRSELARKIDLGNQWLGLDMLIRDDLGKKMDNDTTSVVQVYRAHVDAASRILNDSKPNDMPGITAFSLLVHALSATVDSKAECEFTLSLYDTSEKKFISENFVFYWSFSTGNLTNRNNKVLFNDLGSKEYPSSLLSMEAHRLLLCIRVARIAPIEQISSTLKKHAYLGPPQFWPRQPYAAAVLDLSNVIGNSHSATEHIISLNRDDSLEQLIARASTTRTNNSLKTVNGELSAFGRAQLMISTEVLLGSLIQIKKIHPQIFSSNPPFELRRLSFADIISADDIRNDLYVTLLQGDLHGGKGSDKNIEVRVTVVDTNGIVENSIVMITADGVRYSTTYQSLVFYHDDKPKWNEAIKVQIPENIDQNIHLRITFHHKKAFDKTKQEKGPFALAFARIMEGATLIRDGLHELLVYKVETGRFDDNDTSYTRLPATRGELKASQSQLRPQTTTFIYGEKNFLTIETVTCSTTLTHNKSLLDILRWKQNRSNLKERLEEISKPKFLAVGEELVKFIPNFCDALFEILDHYPEYDSLIFDNLVTLIQLVNEERYKNFRPVLDKYVENFHSTVAFLKLLPVLRERIENAEETHERSLNTMKSLGTLIKLVVRSKLCSNRLGIASNNFQILISELLEAFVVFMQNKRVRMTCQNMALKHIPAIIPHLTYYDVYNSVDLTNFLVRLMDNLGENISSRCRLNFLKNIVQTEHFIQEENRKKLLPKVSVSSTGSLSQRIIEKVVEELETFDFVHLQDVVCDQSKMEECSSASADIMFYIIERLFCSMDPAHEQGTEEELYLIVWKSFRTIVQTTIFLINAKYSASVFCALTIAVLSKLSAQMYKIYLEGHATRIDKHDLLMELVHLFRDLINNSPFPCSWFQMILLQDRMILKTMKFIMSTIVEHFHDDQFNAELWREYMLTMVALCTQKALQLGSPTISERRSRLLSSQPDLRRIAVADLRSMWFRLSMTQKILFVPSMIGSYLRVALVDDDVVRETVIPIFFDMLQCEFHLSPLRNFSKFANETIVQLDCLVDEDCGGEEFKKQLHNIMMDMCRSDTDLIIEGCKFVTLVDTLLQHLFEYREVRTNGYRIENGMDRTVELLKFYKLIGQADLYINYVYKLYDLHMLSNNKIEAAFTLLKHAETLSWADCELPTAILDAHLNRQCGTQRQLKETLYNEAANLFDEKELWEESIGILKELTFQYEKNYEYEKLPSLLQRLAELYHKVSTQGRVACTYFFVGFYGLSFPSYLNNRQFIYRGNECEAIVSFRHRMLSTFPGAQLINTMDECSHLSKHDNKFLQIFPVKPLFESCWEKKCSNRLIRWYFKNNRVQNFEFCKGEIRKGTKWTELEDSEIMRSWVIRRSVSVEEQLPNILHWSQITIFSDPIECSPLMEAVTTMQKNNEEMEEMAHVVLSTPLESVVPLGGKIRGIVQAYVQGGIKNYKIFFSDRCASVLTPEEHELVRHLRILIRNQVPILEFCLYAHASRDHEVNIQFHESLVASFYEYKANIEKQFGKVASQLPTGCSIHLSQQKGDERRASSFETSSTPSVMSVFKRGGGATKSGRTTPRKSSGLKSDLKSAFENGIAKRISSSSDRSFDYNSNENSSTSRSTLDFSRFEHPLKSISSSSLQMTEDDATVKSVKSVERSTDAQILPPPLPPRRTKISLLLPQHLSTLSFPVEASHHNI
uniref:C2 DOCK-type domain-containing protein n=1 Tax=Onchocerca volvulus TaxID=6282 RepID=A0A8R1XZ83_ONCVO